MDLEWDKDKGSTSRKIWDSELRKLVTLVMVDWSPN